LSPSLIFSISRKVRREKTQSPQIFYVFLNLSPLCVSQRSLRELFKKHDDDFVAIIILLLATYY